MEQFTGEFSVKRMVRYEGEGSLRAFCDLAIGELILIKGLRVVEGKKGLFVSMPRQQGKDSKWYDSVIPLTKDAKEAVDQVVLSAYQEHLGALTR